MDKRVCVSFVHAGVSSFVLISCLIWFVKVTFSKGKGTYDIYQKCVCIVQFDYM